MNDIKIDGRGTMNGGTYGDVRVNGSGDCDGDILAQSVEINGMFKCRGAIEAKSFVCDGTTALYDSLTADRIDVDGAFKIEGDGGIRAKTIDCDGAMRLKGNGNIEADTIRCDGFISTEGEVSADKMDINGMLKAREIVGDEIKIRSHMNKFIKHFFSKYSEVGLIEATTVDVSGVLAKSVSGHNVRIGPKCMIDHVICNGTLSISKKAEIKEISGEYTMQE
jgi:cytoskeletal protein CcmA (bactofilin family)